MTQIPEILTIDDIALEVTENYGSSTSIDKAQACRAISRAIQIISRKGRWPFFRYEDLHFNTVANQEAYFLPGNIKLPQFLHMRDPAYKLRLIDLRMLRQMYPNNTDTTGTPRFWRVVNFDQGAQAYQVALWPIPSGVNTIYLDADYNPAMPSDSTDNLTSIGLPTEMQETVIALATALMYEKKDTAMAEQRMQIAASMLDDDFYRLGNHPDDSLNAREYSGTVDLRSEDPILPMQYNGL